MLSLSISSFFENVLHALTVIFNIISDFVSDLLWLFENITLAIGRVPNYLNFLPPSVLSLFMTSITLIVIYKILGRD